MNVVRVWSVMALTGAFVLSACSDDATAPSGIDRDLEIAGKKAPKGGSTASLDAALLSFGDRLNAALEADGSNVRLGVVEYLTASDEVGRTVFFRDVGNKQLAFDFVPGDPRRTDWSGSVGPGDDITWASDMVEGDAGPGLLATQGAIARAMATWQIATCSELPLTGLTPGGDLGVLQYLLPALLGFGQEGDIGGSPDVAADVVQAGFDTGVDAILPPPIIAATFTFRFVDPGGNSTDIDNNGKFDAAFREIYYTDNFPWGIDTNFPIDIETVVLHETGHGLSQAHFGQLFQTDANGKFHFAPRAVMNAGYTGAQQELAGTDDAGHCSLWGSWPSS